MSSFLLEMTQDEVLPGSKIISGPSSRLLPLSGLVCLWTPHRCPSNIAITVVVTLRESDKVPMIKKVQIFMFEGSHVNISSDSSICLSNIIKTSFNLLVSSGYLSK